MKEKEKAPAFESLSNIPIDAPWCQFDLDEPEAPSLAETYEKEDQIS